MADSEQLTLLLPKPLAEQLRAAVEAGEYASTGEAVQDAVRLWGAQRQRRDQDVSWLRQAWDAGKASGRSGPVDLGDLRQEARARFEKAKADLDRAG